MSKGYGGKCRKVTENEELVEYEYSVYNLNMEEHKNSGDDYDGGIFIFKAGLVKPSIIEEIASEEEKLVDRRIHKDVDIESLIGKGLVAIMNSEHTWHFTKGGIDMIGIKLCYLLFEIYQDDECLPDSLTYSV